MPLSVFLAVFAIVVRDLCNLTGGARLLHPLGVEAEEGGGDAREAAEARKVSAFTVNKWIGGIALRAGDMRNGPAAWAVLTL